jgi:hypothetical protein
MFRISRHPNPSLLLTVFTFPSPAQDDQNSPPTFSSRLLTTADKSSPLPPLNLAPPLAPTTPPHRRWWTNPSIPYTSHVLTHWHTPGGGGGATSVRRRCRGGAGHPQGGVGLRQAAHRGVAELQAGADRTAGGDRDLHPDRCHARAGTGTPTQGNPREEHTTTSHQSATTVLHFLSLSRLLRSLARVASFPAPPPPIPVDRQPPTSASIASELRSTPPSAERERGRDGRVPNPSRAALPARPTLRSCRPMQICSSSWGKSLIVRWFSCTSPLYVTFLSWTRCTLLFCLQIKWPWPLLSYTLEITGHPWIRGTQEVKINLDMIIYRLMRAYISSSSLRKSALRVILL